jgi:hypothetical protein
VTELSNPAEGSCSTIGSVVMVAHLLKIEIRRYLYTPRVGGVGINGQRAPLRRAGEASWSTPA